MSRHFAGLAVFIGALAAFAAGAGQAAAADEQAAFVPLQSIVDQAEPGETITLAPGVYEGPVKISKPLALRGEEGGKVSVVNRSDQPAVWIGADGVVLENLAVIDETVKESPAVLVNGDGARLDQLTIRTGSDGIALRDVAGGTVSRTAVEYVPDNVPMADRGNGIDLFNAQRVEIADNLIRNVHDGIYVEQSDDTVITGNRVELSRYGIHLMYTENTVIENNEGDRNITGAMVMAARNVRVSGNTFTKQSENVHSQGILLFDAHDSLFTGNVVEGNRVGFYVEESANNRIEGNLVKNNFIGLWLLNAGDNVLTSNVLIGNVTDAQASGSDSADIDGNYWDSFRGLDLNGDGKSELGYAIRPFFQELVGKKPQFQLFFGSPGMMFLENLYQADRDSWTTDRTPLMAPPDIGGEQQQPAGGVWTGITGLALSIGTMMIIWFARRRIP